MTFSMLWENVDRAVVSSSLGYLSILAWLFAQMPQVIENYNNGSVEGLALPFLVSWLCGDFTNLIGCILTDQLPFQTYLATYFVAVDVALMSQYVYYSRKHPIPHLPPLSIDYPHAQTPRQSYIRRAASRKRKSKSAGSSRRAKSRTGTFDDPMLASWMSESSANTTTTHSPASSRAHTNAYPSRSSSQHFVPRSTSGIITSSPTVLEPPSPTIPERGRTLTRPTRYQTSPALETISGSPASGSPVPDGVGHHGGMLHGLQVAFLPSQAAHHEHRNLSSSHSRSRPPPLARRSTSMVFLSVGLLVTFGRWTGGEAGSVDVATGCAWSVGEPFAAASGAGDWRPSWLADQVRHPALFPLPTAHSSASFAKRSTFPLLVSTPPSDPTTIRVDSLANTYAEGDDGDKNDDKKDEDKPHHGEPYPRRDWQRFVGRASAWLCTTLYLTSRLPQIWQNFRRRSVEGLSMLLFVMAFVGNSLYVSSILISPSMSEPGYLLESLPYLLGSGGTLCFDITIILQSVLYSEKRKAAQERARRRFTRYGVDAEEAAALLDEDNEFDDTDDNESTTTYGHRSSRSASVGGARSKSSRRTISRQRSNSTQLVESGSRAERGILEDHQFDFEIDNAHDSDERPSQPSSSRGSSSSGKVSGSTSQSRTRNPSVASLLDVTIPEAGESSVTIRP